MKKIPKRNAKTTTQKSTTHHGAASAQGGNGPAAGWLAGDWKIRWRAAPSRDFEHPFNGKLGEVIREARKAQGLSRRVVAERAQLSEGTIYNLEHCKGEPSVNVAVRVCDAIGVRYADATMEAWRRCGRARRGNVTVYC